MERSTRVLPQHRQAHTDMTRLHTVGAHSPCVSNASTFIRLSASHVVGRQRTAFTKKARFKAFKWIVVNGQEVLRNDSTCHSYVLKRHHATFLHEQQAEKHHRGHGPTAACSRRRTRRACSKRSRRAQLFAVLSQRALERHHSRQISPPQTMDRGRRKAFQRDHEALAPSVPAP